MSAFKKKTEINLLPLDTFSVGTFGRTLNWLLSTFRVIVIVVELAVMAAFLSRFWLDAKNSDLSDEIRQKEALLTASKQFEDSFNTAKEKIKIYGELTSSENRLSPNLINLPNLLPEGIILRSFNLSGPTTSLDGSAQTTEQIAQLMANLEATEKYKNPLLGQISLDEESRLYLFKIDIF